MEQKEAIAKLATAAQAQGALVVSEIGSQTVWLHDTGDHPSYLYLSGPMGMAPSVVLGVALSNPDKPVLAICGDGALAMNFSALVTISDQAPPNLTIALMDNGVYDFTGKAPSPSQTVNWKNLVSGLSGFKSFQSISEAPIFSSNGGLAFIHAPVKPASGKAKPFPFTGPQIYDRFLSYVQNL
ncbi:thiamine pyrophosphate-dependent enzyme [Alphaproteobacteria bacterium]|nr:thiamine pyrophosphate-dependent enzyme [Alphaproteobacteria bacterium]